MMKKLVSLILVCAVTLSLCTPAMAAREEIHYYRVDMKQYYSETTYVTVPIDLMIVPAKEEIYINAEHLGTLSDNCYRLSEKDCAYTTADPDERDEDAEQVVYYKYNSKQVTVYLSGQPISYTMPYTAKYIDEVGWIPLDFGMKMLNIVYYIDENGARCNTSYTTVFDVAHRILEGEFTFDYAKELNVSDFNMFALETGSFLSVFFNGLATMEGSCWGTLITSPTGNTDLYDGMIAEDVCDLFIMPSKSEAVDKAAGCLKIIPGLWDIDSALKDGYDLHYERVSWTNEKIASENYKKLMKNTEMISTQVTEATKGLDLSKVFEKPNWMDAVNVLIEYGAMKLKLENRDALAVEALQYYGEQCQLNVATAVGLYSKNVKMDNGVWWAAAQRYFIENWDNFILGQLSLGHAALASIGWSIASNHVPYFKDGLDNTKNFQYAKYAAIMQSDAYRILDEDYTKTLSSKKMREGNLENVANGCYAYLKLALIARECTISSIQKAPKVDAATKAYVVKVLEDRNAKVAEMLSVISNVKKGNFMGVNNENGAYKPLLPSENGEYCRKLDDSCTIDAVTGEVGTLIAKSSQETPPEKNVVITEEEAIAMVRNALNKYTMGLMESSLLEDMYSYECLALCDAYIIDLEAEGILNDTAVFETDYCYIIAHCTDGSVDALFCVPADGTGAYIGAQYDDGYGYLRNFNLNNLTVKELIKVMKQFSGLLFEEMVAEYNTETVEQNTSP